jgi:hypothetical protein
MTFARKSSALRDSKRVTTKASLAALRANHFTVPVLVEPTGTARIQLTAGMPLAMREARESIKTDKVTETGNGQTLAAVKLAPWLCLVAWYQHATFACMAAGHY